MKSLALILLVSISQLSHAQESDKHLVLGSGGGITGLWQFYKIKENGEILFRVNLASSYEKIGKISKKSALDIFKEAADFKLDSLALNQPGNMSYMLEYQPNGNKQKAIWGSSTDPAIPESIQDFYEKTLNLVRSKR